MWNVKAKLAASVLALCVVMLGVVIWYRIPVEKQMTVTLCSKDGEQVEAVFDVSWQRYVFALTELEGTITLEDTEYISVMSTSAPLDRGDFFAKLRAKLEDTPYMPYFILSGQGGMEAYSSQVFLTHVDRNFERICLSVIWEGETRGKEYYGPAETVEEVENIINELY